MNNTNTLGRTLRELRKKRGMTLQELAEKTHSHVGNLSRIERGLSKPSIDFLYQIARALDFSLQDIFGLAEKSSTVDEDLSALTAIFLALLDSDKKLLLEFANLLQCRASEGRNDKALIEALQQAAEKQNRKREKD